MLKGKAYDGKAVDVWSCGCSLYILLCADYPFRTGGHCQAATPIKRMQAMFPKLCAGDYNPLRPEVRRPHLSLPREPFRVFLSQSARLRTDGFSCRQQVPRHFDSDTGIRYLNVRCAL